MEDTPTSVMVNDHAVEKLKNEVKVTQFTWKEYIGVYERSPGRFAAMIRYPDSHWDWLGVYKTLEKATSVYDQEAYRIYGSQAMLNFPHLLDTTKPFVWTPPPPLPSSDDDDTDDEKN